MAVSVVGDGLVQVDPGPGLVLSLVKLVAVALEVADVAGALKVAADPSLVLLVGVGLDPVLVDPGPCLVLCLVEIVSGALEVADVAGGLKVAADPVLVLLGRCWSLSRPGRSRSAPCSS